MTHAQVGSGPVRLCQTSGMEKIWLRAHVRQMSWHIANYEIVLSWPFVLMLCILPTILTVVAVARIVQRVGFSGWWALIILVPFANMVALWYLAFTRWPAQRSPSDSSDDVEKPQRYPEKTGPQTE
jgi:hypothetical protein